MSRFDAVRVFEEARRETVARRRTPPLECVLCGLRCWNDDSVAWFTPSWGGDAEPYCVANGCAARRERIERRNREQQHG